MKNKFLKLLDIKKDRTPSDFLFDEINVDSYFFHSQNTVQKRAIRLSTGLLLNLYQLNSVFEPIIVY